MMHRLIVLVTLLLCTHVAHANSLSYLSLRSQGAYAARRMAGWIDHTYTKNPPSFAGALAASVNYARSCHNDRITHALFGDALSSKDSITISGSRVTGRGEKDLLADHFYLPTNYESTLCFSPRIDSFITDFQLHFNLSDIKEGLYFNLYAPLTHTRAGLHMHETITNKSVNDHEAGYFGPDTIVAGQLMPSFSAYASGTQLPPLQQSVASSNFTVILQGLCHARISPQRRVRTRIADLRTELGYSFMQEENWRFAMHAHIVAPSGNHPDATYLLAPVAGNGHHWEVGFGSQFDAQIWASQDEHMHLSFHLLGNLAHVLGSTQQRTFDLSGKPLSRYMLAERLGTPITHNLKGGGTVPTAQFKNEFAPVANLTTFNVNVKSAVHLDLVAQAHFSYKQWSFDAGYNLWLRSCERIELASNAGNPLVAKEPWALKGDAHVFGFDRGITGTGALVGAVPLSATQSSATIFSGKNFTSTTSISAARKNPAIDNPQDATGDGAGGALNISLSAVPTGLTDERIIQTSIQPVLISMQDISVCGSGTRGLSNSVFGHAAYTWECTEGWRPYLGIGGLAEFGHSPSTCSSSSSCSSIALSQWNVWLKGGVEFN